MKIRDLRGLSKEALEARLAELRLDTGIERRKVASTGVASKKGAKLKEMRRTVAQILTLLNERGAKS